MNEFDALAEHVSYFEELGVNGVSRDPLWRERGIQEGELSARVSRKSDTRLKDRIALTEAVGVEEDRTSHGDKGDHESEVPSDRPPAERLIVARNTLGECTRCELHSTRTHLVFGTGNPDAELMFVGEAPGRDEDREGVPFVGRAGQLLTKIIESIDFRRDDVYIANVIKCRPPKNRNPTPTEIETCEPFLFAQVDAIRPRVIVALGAFATRTLLRSEEPISKVRGKVFNYRGATLIPTYHPAFLLRSPDRKRDVWEDMKRVRTILRTGR